MAFCVACKADGDLNTAWINVNSQHTITYLICQECYTWQWWYSKKDLRKDDEPSEMTQLVGADSTNKNEEARELSLSLNADNMVAIEQRRVARREWRCPSNRDERIAEKRTLKPCKKRQTIAEEDCFAQQLAYFNKIMLAICTMAVCNGRRTETWIV